MFPYCQKNIVILFLISLLIGTSIACIIGSLPGIGNPDRLISGEIPTKKREDLQEYMGTSETEGGSTNDLDGEICPPVHPLIRPNGLFNHKIDGNTLILTDKDLGLSTHLPYDSVLGAFCRTNTTNMIINQKEVEIPITECVSYQTIGGVKVSNFKRYYDINESPKLCYDQTNNMKNQVVDQNEPVSDSSLLGQCLASPDMYLVEFSNVSDEYSNESKEVCQGVFIIHNLSNENISLRYYHIFDDGTKHTEDWTYLHISIEPGEKTERYFGSQKWTDGSSTIDTFTKLIVVRSSLECTNLITDDNISILDDNAIPLNDPCR